MTLIIVTVSIDSVLRQWAVVAWPTNTFKNWFVFLTRFWQSTSVGMLRAKVSLRVKSSVIYSCIILHCIFILSICSSFWLCCFTLLSQISGSCNIFVRCHKFLNNYIATCCVVIDLYTFIHLLLTKSFRYILSFLLSALSSLLLAIKNQCYAKMEGISSVF